MTETLLEMATRHREMDMLAAGRFEFTDGQACSIGCFNRDLGQPPGDIQAYADHFGIPHWAADLQERLFENLPATDRLDWHVAFARKAEKLTDWVVAYHRTMIAILEVALPHDASPGRVVQRVIDLHRRGPEVAQSEWDAARDAARAAAWDAAWATARAAAGAAARDAAYRQIRDGFLAA